MNREYHKWYSPALRREMELLVYGHSGTPLIIFPTSMGRFFDYENRDMVSVIAQKYDSGQLQGFSVDSVDKESWYNRSVHPSQRARRHNEYDRYILDEVVPFIRSRNASHELVATGCSFGGYHCMISALRHPETFTGAVSMGGAFDVKQFLDGYYDENCYFNDPHAFIPNLSDDRLLGLLRRQRLIFGTGENDICLDENIRLSNELNAKGIGNCLSVWRDGTGHDWPWWQRMAQQFL